MTPLDILSDFLDPDYHPDYWADDCVLSANDLVRKLTPEDWDRIPSHIPSKPAPWQTRPADALDAAPAERAVPILLTFLLSPHPGVSRQAVNSLYAFHSQGHPIPLSPEITDRLRAIAAESRIYAALINAILHGRPAVLPRPPA